MLFRVGISDSTGLMSHGLIGSIAREMVDRTITRIKPRLEERPTDPKPATKRRGG